MGGAEIGAWLSKYAAAVPPGQAIVEVGCWLGAGTAHLAEGAATGGAPVHVYDRWRAVPSEVRKAARAGITLKPGQNTLPLVKDALKTAKAEIHWHRGDILKARWVGGPIGLYVDDASKFAPAWHHVMATFGPFLAHGAILVLMDYRWPHAKAQKLWMARNRRRFEMIEDRMAGTSASVFRHKTC